MRSLKEKDLILRVQTCAHPCVGKALLLMRTPIPRCPAVTMGSFGACARKLVLVLMAIWPNQAIVTIPAGGAMLESANRFWRRPILSWEVPVVAGGEAIVRSGRVRRALYSNSLLLVRRYWRNSNILSNSVRSGGIDVAPDATIAGDVHCLQRDLQLITILEEVSRDN